MGSYRSYLAEYVQYTYFILEKPQEKPVKELLSNNTSKKWMLSIRDWKAVVNRFSIQFERRILPLNSGSD